MPIYEYKCLKCSEIFEAFQKFDDQPLSECKFCHGGVEKLISHTSFQLKGSGWYLTDYAKKAQPAHTEVKDTTKPKDQPAAGAEKASTTTPKSGDSST